MTSYFKNNAYPMQNLMGPKKEVSFYKTFKK